MTTKIIAVSNQKGGVGKTTTAIHLAHALAQKDKAVLLVDTDPQSNCTTALGLKPEPGVFYLLTVGQAPQDTTFVRQFVRPTGRDGLWLIPGDPQTVAAQVTMNAMNKPVSAVRDSLARFTRNGLDYIILDTSPSLGGLQERCLWAADLVLVPTAADYLSTDGVRMLVETLGLLKRERAWNGALLGVLPTFIEDNVREHKAGLAELQQAFGGHVLPPIHKAATLRECPGMGVTIFEKDPHSRAAQEYQELVKLVLKY